MSTVIFPVLQSPNWKMTRSPQWSTQVKTASSGDRKRNPLQAHTLWKWTLKNGVLQAEPSIADLQAIEDLFIAMFGRYDFFLWTDPEGDSIEDPAVQINVGGTYYWPVAFTHDTVDFDRFAYQLWTCGTLEFEQVGFGTFAGAGGSVIGTLQQPNGPITAATLSVLTSHIPGTGYAGIAEATTGALGILSFSGPPFIEDTAAWTLRTDTVSMDPATLSTSHVLFSIGGSLGGSAAPADEFRIYEVSLGVTYQDTSTAILRPTVATVFTGEGTITNPNRAIDGNSATYAAIDVAHFGPLANYAVLAVSNFA